jgi:hypothetical protein
MTTQTIHIHTFDYGASLSSATLRNVSDDTLVATADTVNEVTADSGLYAAVFGEVSVIAAGEYRLRAVVGGKPINRYVTLDGTNNEVVEARNERLSVLDSAATAALVVEVAVTLHSPSKKRYLLNWIWFKLRPISSVLPQEPLHYLLLQS